MDREGFLAERRKGIGGSDIAAILGLSKYKTPYDVWLSKRGEDDREDEAGEAAYWGTVLEDVVAKEYAIRTGRKVQRVNSRMVHPEAPFAHANIDRAVVNPDVAGIVRWNGESLTTDRILECKTASAYLSQEWGAEGTDEIPEYYLTQGIWYCGITGATVCDVAVLIGGQSYRLYEVPAAPDLFSHMLDEAREFWGMVESGEAPEPRTLDDARHRWREARKDATAIVGPDAYQAVKRIGEINKEIKALEREKEAQQLVVMKAMGDAEYAEHGGEVIASWKEQTTTRLDQKALKEAQPGVYAMFAKTTKGRLLRPRKIKEVA